MATRIEQARKAMARRMPQETDPNPNPRSTPMNGKTRNTLRPARLAGSARSTARHVEQPEVGEDGYERHPAFAMIAASRVSHGPNGAVLFDSDIRHNRYVTITLQEAARKRDLNHDRIHPERRLFEVALSEAQWASFVSSMNTTGVACTLTGLIDDPMVAGMPYEPRLQESMAEVRGAADKAVAGIVKALEAVKEKPTKANLRSLEAAISNAAPNIEFAATSLNEHAENVVQKARADIEAMVVNEAARLGLEPGDLIQGLPALTEGEKS